MYCSNIDPVRALYLLGLLFVVAPAACRTIYLEQVAPTLEEVSFMKRFGYLGEAGADAAGAYTAQSIADSVRQLQGFAGLPRTGLLDAETKGLFKKKRCGVRDIGAVPTRQRRYVIQQGWNKKSITYRVLNGSSTLGKDRVESIMAAALEVWAPHVGLHFYRKDAGEADIEVSFASGDHGDGFPFDGPGRVVAHAFCPPLGAMHFDDAETWGERDGGDEDEDATELFAVAAHEVGHALGMAHSDVKASVMYPYYQVPVVRLHPDDILGMQELYFKDQLGLDPEPGTESPVVSHASRGPGERPGSTLSGEDEPPDLCYTNYDTIQVLRGKIYVFEEEWMWVLSDRNEIDAGYPKRFRDVFTDLPDDVTVVRATYENRKGNIVIFSGRYYWEFGPNFHLIKRGHLSDYSLPSYLPELSTVFLSNYNNKTYLIEDERFWRYNEDAGTMDQGYPKEMSAWRDVPYPVDSAVIWKGATYFFRGGRFWRFDDGSVRAHPYYPAPVAQLWFHCASTDDMDKYVVNED